jgi:uncharacterized protein (DUF1501 family)
VQRSIELTRLPTAGIGSRRSFLQVGSLGLAGLAMPNLVRARQAQAAESRKDTAVILLWMAGGPSHIDMVDMKPNAMAEVRGPFSPIRTNTTGIEVCELLPGHVEIADKLAIVRSLHHDLGVHDDASHWVQTGYPLLNARQRGQQHPAQGAVVSKLRGANAPGMPAYVCVPESYRRHMGFYQLSTYLSSRHDPLDAGGDPSLGNYRPPDFALPDGFAATRLEDRRGMLHQLDRLAAETEANPLFQSLDQSQQQAFELVTGSRARQAFDLSQESAKLRERYGRHQWGQSALLARRLVEAGVTFVTVNLYEKDIDWWDDHYTLETNLRQRLPVFDQMFSTLVTDLSERGMLDRTLVLACGEFGRSPRIDKNAGRGHWPRAGAAVLAGGGIRGGQTIGSTTADGGEPHTRPFGPGDLLASVYQVLGIDPQAALPDRQNRPIPIVPAGEPIRELFS